jgi:acetyl esterase/lipase
MIAVTDELVLQRLGATGLTSDGGMDVTEIPVGAAVAYEVAPPALDPGDRRVYLDPHGGAFIQGGGQLCRFVGMMMARRFGMRTWALDYRMPPDHPFPAALDDCVAAYSALLERADPSQVVVGGTSAGGNLAAALALRARDEGLPSPAATILLTPALDLTLAGDTWSTNFGVDTVLVRRTGGPELYAAGHDLRDPYLSPLFGDFSKGFPPTFLASGTRDVLLSDTVRMHRALRRAGVAAELHVLEAAPHGFFGGQAPEDRELDEEVRRFIATYCPCAE